MALNTYYQLLDGVNPGQASFAILDHDFVANDGAGAFFNWNTGVLTTAAAMNSSTQIHATGTISGNPLFINPANNQFGLLVTSQTDQRRQRHGTSPGRHRFESTQHERYRRRHLLQPEADNRGLIRWPHLDILSAYVNNTGYANVTFGYGPADGKWTPLVGDWNGDGIDTIGLYNPVTSTFYLRNSNTTGTANTTFAYGPAGGGWTPIVGDWNGDGIDTVGLYNPATSTFYLRNSNTTGVANITFGYGPAGGGWKPIVGDWNNDGIDTVGLYNPTTSTFYLRNSNTTGMANASFAYGPAGRGWTPMSGIWSNTTYDSVGLYNPANAGFYLRNTDTTGMADLMFNYGSAGSPWVPLAGNWSGTGGFPVPAAPGNTTPLTAVALSDAAPGPIVNRATTAWASAGLSATLVAPLGGVSVVASDLAPQDLGGRQDNAIYLNRSAASLNDELTSTDSPRELRAINPQALDQMDLLTVVEQELGHVIGLTDLDS